jgi:hypothetical protein
MQTRRSNDMTEKTDLTVNPMLSVGPRSS